MNNEQTTQLHKHIVMPSCLRLSLKTNWFEMTKAGIKTEDYREINQYWWKRLVQCGECYRNFSDSLNDILAPAEDWKMIIFTNEYLI